MKYFLFVLFLGVNLACKNSPAQQHINEQAPKKDQKVYSVEDPILFRQVNLYATISWLQDPKVDDSSFMIRFWRDNANGPYANPGEKLSIKLWMPDMGHGSSPVKITQQATGEYLVERVNFVMAGAWEIQIMIKNNADQVVDQVNVPITI